MQLEKTRIEGCSAAAWRGLELIDHCFSSRAAGVDEVVASPSQSRALIRAAPRESMKDVPLKTFD